MPWPPEFHLFYFPERIWLAVELPMHSTLSTETRMRKVIHSNRAVSDHCGFLLHLPIVVESVLLANMRELIRHKRLDRNLALPRRAASGRAKLPLSRQNTDAMRLDRSVALPAMLLMMVAALFLLVGVAWAQDDDSTEEPGYIREIEEQFPVVDDPEINERVGRISERLIAVIPEEEKDDREITVKVLRDDSVNAFALPNGYVYLFEGLVDACETDDMLAAVMAHEFTHVIHRHHSRIADRQIRGMLVGLVAMVASGEAEALMLGQMMSASMTETYGRAAENDADRNGVTLMVQAGFDPLGYLELLQVLEQDAIHRPEPGGNYFTIHPHPDQRIEQIRETLAGFGIELPDDVYRVHLPLVFFLPLSDAESKRLEEWQQALLRRAESSGDEESDREGEDESAQVEEIPPSLLREYQLREQLFEEVIPPEDGVYGVVTAGENGIFYISSETDEELMSAADSIISRLGALFLEGLRDYEIQARTLSNGPSLVARRRRIATVSDTDAALLGLSREQANEERVSVLKDVLYHYYVNRRI